MIMLVHVLIYLLSSCPVPPIRNHLPNVVLHPINILNHSLVVFQPGEMVGGMEHIVRENPASIFTKSRHALSRQLVFQEARTGSQADESGFKTPILLLVQAQFRSHCCYERGREALERELRILYNSFRQSV